MFWLVTGGSGSGKSLYGEELLQRLWEKNKKAEKIYLATMRPEGREAKARIARHRRQRAGKGFITEECPGDLGMFVEEKLRGKTPPPFVLLECMSNLTANLLFDGDFSADREKLERTAGKIESGLLLLEQVCQDVVVVTNEVCSESASDSPEMQGYKRLLSRINRWLAARSRQVTEVVYGIPAGVKPLPEEREKGAGTGMKLVIGGAWQGKLEFAAKRYSQVENWIDGSSCALEISGPVEGMYHIEEYIRRWMEREGEEQARRQMLSLCEKNPGLVLICREIGYGLVPADAFERRWREQVGRICTELAKQAEEVYRVVCGVGLQLK